MDPVKKALLDQGLKVSVSNGGLIIRRKGAQSIMIVCFLLALPLMIIGSFAGVGILLFGIALIAAPFLLARWQSPAEIHFPAKSDMQLLRGPFNMLKETIPYADLTELRLERTVKTAEVSPFMEGNKEFVYNFVTESSNGRRHELLRLVYRPDNQQEVESIRSFLLPYIHSLKSEG